MPTGYLVGSPTGPTYVRSLLARANARSAAAAAAAAANSSATAVNAGLVTMVVGQTTITSIGPLVVAAGQKVIASATVEYDLANTANGGAVGRMTMQISGIGIETKKSNFANIFALGDGTVFNAELRTMVFESAPLPAGPVTIVLSAAFSGAGLTVPAGLGRLTVQVVSA